MKDQDNNIAIKLRNISKQYTIHHEKPTLVEKFYKGKDEKFWALRDINLTIKRGDRVGIIGPNGSGKTTLLKIITGITTPTAGTVKTYGKVVSLIDLEAGFHDDLTGEQNIYLNGMLIGMTQKETKSKLNDIIDFADIKQFIDTPLFTYSQGMKLRLGFAVTIYSQPDIIVLDENLSVGDQYFQIKALKTINNLVTNKGVTIIYVSHNTVTLKALCNKIIWINNGKIFRSGNSTLLSIYTNS